MLGTDICYLCNVVYFIILPYIACENIGGKCIQESKLLHPNS